MSRVRVWACLSVAVVIPVFALWAAAPKSGAPETTLQVAKGEWPQWRGPRRDGISTETGLLKEWSADGPPVAWQIKGLGKGYSSVAIAGGKIFTMGRRGASEFLIALDLEGGSELWATDAGDASHSNCTPTIDGELVYALGRKGDLVCAQASDGKEVWRKNFGKDFGGRMMSGWGYSESPLVDGNGLVCTPGAQDSAIAMLNKKTGEVIWKAGMPEDIGRRGKDGSGYSSIVISEACGVRQYVQLTGRGVISVRAKDGKTLWGYNRVANGTANIPTPIVKGDHVFCSSGYGTGSALLKLTRSGDDFEVEEVYFKNGKEMQNHHGGMILLGDYIYCGHGHNQGFPLCIEMLTGKVAWKPGRGAGTGSAAIVFADDHLYFRYQNGVMALIEADPSSYQLKGQFDIAIKNGNSWPHPVIASGKLYLRDQDELVCYDIRAK